MPPKSTNKRAHEKSAKRRGGGGRGGPQKRPPLAGPEAEADRKARMRRLCHINKKLKPAKGQIISKREMVVVLRLYFHLLLNEKIGPEGAAQHASESLGIARSVVESARDEFVEEHTVRGRGGSRHEGNHGAKAPPGTTLRLREKIERTIAGGRQVTASTLQSWLASEPSVKEVPGRIPVHVSHQTVCNWLLDLGFHKAKGKTGYALSEERKRRIREYVIEVSKALALDRDPHSPYKIVYMDESHLHVNHRDGVSWFELDRDRATNPKGRGGRIVFFHAITEDGPVVANEWRDGGHREGFPHPEGWLASELGQVVPRKGKGRSSCPEGEAESAAGSAWGGVEGAASAQGADVPGSSAADGDEAEGVGVGPTHMVISDEPTAEMIFPAGNKNSEDYHENIDCNLFMAWLDKRLWPTFRRMYGDDRKMILVLDNAVYHHGMEDGWKNPLEMNKAECAALLNDLGIGAISVSRRGKVMNFEVPGDGSTFPKAPKGPSIIEAQHAAFKALQERRPDDVLTRAERWFKKNDAGYMVFTPPYCPNFQPMELFWGEAKHYVARTYEDTRNMQEAAMWLRRGWYGGEAIGHHGAKAPIDCKQLVDHSLRMVNEVIARDEMLTGSAEGGLEHFPSSYKVSLGSGLEALDTCDEVELLEADVIDEDESDWSGGD